MIGVKRPYPDSDNDLDFDDSYDCDEPNFSGYAAKTDPLVFADVLASAPEWKQIRLGTDVIQVSSHGDVRKSGAIFQNSNGWIVPGTPYRSFMVYYGPGDTREYYIHDIVWRAFNGDPPPGWRVVHKAHGCYNNNIENLTIVPWNIVDNPVLFDQAGWRTGTA